MHFVDFRPREGNSIKRVSWNRVNPLVFCWFPPKFSSSMPSRPSPAPPRALRGARALAAPPPRMGGLHPPVFSPLTGVSPTSPSPCRGPRSPNPLYVCSVTCGLRTFDTSLNHSPAGSPSSGLLHTLSSTSPQPSLGCPREPRPLASPIPGPWFLPRLPLRHPDHYCLLLRGTTFCHARGQVHGRGGGQAPLSPSLPSSLPGTTTPVA